MSKSTLHSIAQPQVEGDLLHELIRSGARQIISAAVEAELAQLLEQYNDLKDARGRRAVVRNGYLPERTVQTGVGDVAVKVPKVRDRSGSGVKFNSALLPPYLKRAKSVDELIPWLYLRGVSTGDFQEALGALVGEQAKGLSASTISRLKECWLDEHKAWQRRDLNGKRYVYLWADGVYSNVRQDDRLCLLVIVGVTEHGRKELVAIEDGYRESEASWLDVLRGLQQRGLATVPKLATGDGALGFWKALHKVFPQTRQRRCTRYGRQRHGSKPTRHLIPPWFAFRISTRRPWSVCPKIGKSCWRSMTILLFTGYTFARLIRLSRPLPRCA